MTWRSLTAYWMARAIGSAVRDSTEGRYARDRHPLDTVVCRDADRPRRRWPPIELIQARYPEEMLGGYDNYHDVADARGRAGGAVVTSYFATNSQQGDPPAP